MRLVEPVGYLDSIGLAESAACVLTDSGGLQEETTFLRVPCLILRPNTERPITITEGSNRLTMLARLTADLDEAIVAGTRAGACRAQRCGREGPGTDHGCASRVMRAASVPGTGRIDGPDTRPPVRDPGAIVGAPFKRRRRSEVQHVGVRASARVV